MSVLQKVLEGQGFETRSYSGRGMYGKQCLGVSVSGGFGEFLSALVKGISSIESENMIDLIEEVSKVETDSLGMGTIVYFPKVDFEEEDEVEENFLP